MDSPATWSLTPLLKQAGKQKRDCFMSRVYYEVDRLLVVILPEAMEQGYLVYIKRDCKSNTLDVDEF